MPSTKASTNHIEVVEVPKKIRPAATNGISVLSEMEPQMIEKSFRSALGKAKTIAKEDDATEDILIAKLADYAIRELHARELPMTAIRAMMLMETAEERRSISGCLNQAFREMKAEAKAKRELESTEENKENKENVETNGKA